MTPAAWSATGPALPRTRRSSLDLGVARLTAGSNAAALVELERRGDHVLYGKTGWQFNTTPQLGWWQAGCEPHRAAMPPGQSTHNGSSLRFEYMACRSPGSLVTTGCPRSRAQTTTETSTTSETQLAAHRTPTFNAARWFSTTTSVFDARSSRARRAWRAPPRHARASTPAGIAIGVALARASSTSTAMSRLPDSNAINAPVSNVTPLLMAPGPAPDAPMRALRAWAHPVRRQPWAMS